ncbi:conserved hypothetical protein [Ricinus communis]|uniref:Uncharacterized protein n=1 Tax=Ricinus communis TaxID=3988 RepID=B9TEU0_RICCO|nr:conserved hypothetical protein [Ricinus communis]
MMSIPSKAMVPMSRVRIVRLANIINFQSREDRSRPMAGRAIATRIRIRRGWGRLY